MATEVRPAEGNAAAEPETAPEAHLADMAQQQQKHVDFEVLVSAFDRISATTKRLEMTGKHEVLLCVSGSVMICSFSSGTRTGPNPRCSKLSVHILAVVFCIGIQLVCFTCIT